MRRRAVSLGSVPGDTPLPGACAPRQHRGNGMRTAEWAKLYRDLRHVSFRECSDCGLCCMFDRLWRPPRLLRGERKYRLGIGLAVDPYCPLLCAGEVPCRDAPVMCRVFPFRARLTRGALEVYRVTGGDDEYASRCPVPDARLNRLIPRLSKALLVLSRFTACRPEPENEWRLLASVPVAERASRKAGQVCPR